MRWKRGWSLRRLYEMCTMYGDRHLALTDISTLWWSGRNQRRFSIIGKSGDGNLCACMCQIRVVNAFQMDMDSADSFDRRSLCSLRSQQSLQHFRMLSIHRSTSHDGDVTGQMAWPRVTWPSCHQYGTWLLHCNVLHVHPHVILVMRMRVTRAPVSVMSIGGEWRFFIWIIFSYPALILLHLLASGLETQHTVTLYRVAQKSKPLPND